eukprot:scaffold44083_cov20-Prasinocladus_malaysianus.AAC.1
MVASGYNHKATHLLANAVSMPTMIENASQTYTCSDSCSIDTLRSEQWDNCHWRSRSSLVEHGPRLIKAVHFVVS